MDTITEKQINTRLHIHIIDSTLIANIGIYLYIDIKKKTQTRFDYPWKRNYFMTALDLNSLASATPARVGELAFVPVCAWP